jgi:hypothetical protein
MPDVIEICISSLDDTPECWLGLFHLLLSEVG